MKASVTAVCATAAIVLVSTLAETRTPHTLQPASLARFEAITSYCEKADPSAESLYLSKLAGLTTGHSEQEILADRNTSDYQRAMAQAGDVLSRASQATAVKACGEFLAGN